MSAIGIWSGIFEFVFCLALGLLVTFVSFRMFPKLFSGLDTHDSLANNQVASALVLGSMIVGVGYVVLQTLSPAVSTFQTSLLNGLSVMSVTLLCVYLLGYVVGALIAAILGLSLSVRVFLWLTTEIDELAEIRANNVAVAVALSAVILTLSIFLGSGVESLLSALVPVPELATVEIIGA